MKRLALGALAIVSLATAPTAYAQTELGVDPATMTAGFMNVYNLPAPDGDGAFQFADSWGFADLTATFDGTELTLGPNTIGDVNEYWYQCPDGVDPPNCGGPGAPGNKIMEANAYAEVLDGSLAGQTVVFRFVVTSNTLTEAHVVRAFVRDFAPDFSSVNEQTMEIAGAGLYEVTLATIDDAARPVQYGFQMVGVNVWTTDVGPFGTVVISPAPVSGATQTFGAIKSLFD